MVLATQYGRSLLLIPNFYFTNELLFGKHSVFASTSNSVQWVIAKNDIWLLFTFSSDIFKLF